MILRKNSTGSTMSLSFLIVYGLLLVSLNWPNGVVAVALQSVPSSNQPAINDVMAVEENWENLSSAPLIFKISQNKRSLLLVNSSSKQVVRYQLACVLRQGRRLKLVKTLPATSITLEPEVGMIINPLPVGDKVVEVCAAPPARFVVWRAQFADGIRWKAF